LTQVPNEAPITGTNPPDHAARGLGARAGEGYTIRARARPFRVLALIPDAFGSLGGIAKFNRDLLGAICAHTDCAEVVAMPRLMPAAPGALPRKLTWVTDGLGGKLRFLRAALRCARGNQPAAAGRAAPLALTPPSGFDLVICGHINLLPAAFIARKFMRSTAGATRSQWSPLVLVIHGLDAWAPHRSALVRSLARRVDALVSVSAFTANRFLRWSGAAPEQNYLLPNCVDLSAFSPGEKDNVLLERYGLRGKQVLLTVGRLVRTRPKGIDEVMELLPDLAREMPEIAYLIAGDGPDRSRLLAKAAQLGLEGRVVFAGQVPESEKAAHYRLADAFVMPGYGEGFGIVYLEALACGIPVLASTLDASREALLDGKMGVLVDPRNGEDLRRGLLRVLQQPRGCVPRDLEHFSLPSFTRRCHKIMDKLCPAGGEWS